MEQKGGAEGNWNNEIVFWDQVLRVVVMVVVMCVSLHSYGNMQVKGEWQLVNEDTVLQN
jgi:hypothetical protein